MSEEEFLRSTPRKLFKLAEIHKKMNSSDEDLKKEQEQEEEVYIDNISI